MVKTDYFVLSFQAICHHSHSSPPISFIHCSPLFIFVFLFIQKTKHRTEPYLYGWYHKLNIWLSGVDEVFIIMSPCLNFVRNKANKNSTFCVIFHYLPNILSLPAFNNSNNENHHQKLQKKTKRKFASGKSEYLHGTYLLKKTKTKELRKQNMSLSFVMLSTWLAVAKKRSNKYVYICLFFFFREDQQWVMNVEVFIFHSISQCMEEIPRIKSQLCHNLCIPIYHWKWLNMYPTVISYYQKMDLLSTYEIWSYGVWDCHF